jgi:peptidoglycan/LPS O-acetylase OafA/YrhL
MDRNNSVDALRALGALLVFSFHTHCLLGGEFRTGWVGVSLFFVVSGYLIGGRLLELADRGPPVKAALATFYWRRTLRIFPVYGVYLLLVSLIAMATAMPVLIEQLPYAWTYTSNFMHASAAYRNNPFLGPTWTLAVEEQFYLLFPLVVLLLGRRRLALAIFVMILAGPLLRTMLCWTIDTWPQHFNDKATAINVAGFTHIDAFAFGALINLLPRERRAWLGRGPHIAAALLIAMVLGGLATHTLDGAFYWAFPADAGGHLVWAYSVINIVSMMLVCRAVAQPADAFGRATAPMARFGQWSYSFYLVHWPVMSLVAAIPAALGLAVPGWLGIVIALGLASLLARLLYETIEKPGQGLWGLLGSSAGALPAPDAAR